MNTDRIITTQDAAVEELFLKNGEKIEIRAIRKDDLGRWISFVSGLSNRTKYLRFHSLPKLTAEDAQKFCSVDHFNNFAVVALVAEKAEHRIIAIGRYSRLNAGNTAEVAIVIDDSHQGLGIGGKLMETLINVARKNNIGIFEADILAENTGVIRMLKKHGVDFTGHFQSGVCHIRFPVSLSE